MNNSALVGAGTPFNYPEAIGYQRAPFSNVIAGDSGLTASPNGVAINLFAWADPNSGLVSNAFTPGFLIGLVLPILWAGDPRRTFVQFGSPFPLRLIRSGLGVAMASAGNFRTRFAGGGQAGSRVWADPVTGLPYADSNSGAYIATPWTLMQSGGCNASLQISSFAEPFLNIV
jgi:hypothetical protein